MIQAVIFDLDGVLVSTDELHYAAWKKLAERYGITRYTKEDNIRQRGVSRMASLEILLEKADRSYSEEEKLQMAEEKNNDYKELLKTLSPADVLPGAKEFLGFLKARGVKTAVGSASKNAPEILERTGLLPLLDGVSCGLDITHSKPHPEVFLVAAQKVGIAPQDCVVVEDAAAGIEAAKRAGMTALAVGAACGDPRADLSVQALDQLDYTGCGLF